MSVETSVMIAMVMGCLVAATQDVSDLDLARQLATESTRRSAVARIVASRRDKVPLLLSWTRNPPANVDEHELSIGLADAFGQLKTKEAIPYLIKNIGIERWRDVNTWLKTDDVIEERLPAVAALIQIGPEAYDALVRASWKPMDTVDRRAVVFAAVRIVSKTKDPEARRFFHSVLAEANMLRYWAEAGLKVLDGAR